jgi:hypothetical protein
MIKYWQLALGVSSVTKTLIIVLGRLSRNQVCGSPLGRAGRVFPGSLNQSLFDASVNCICNNRIFCPDGDN